MTADNLSFKNHRPVAESSFHHSHTQNPGLSYVSTLAFEARDPLTIICLASEQLQSECDDAEKATCLAMLGKAVLQISSLINRIIEHEHSTSSENPA